MNPWYRRALRRVAIRKGHVRKIAAPYAGVVVGSRAFREGLSPVECPYSYGQLAWTYWILGWLMAFDKEQERE